MDKRAIFIIIIALCILSTPMVALIGHGIQQGIITYWQHVWTGVHDPHLAVPAWHAMYYSIIIASMSSFIALGLGYALCTAHKHPAIVHAILALPFFIGPIGCTIAFDALAHNTWLCGLPALTISHALLNYPYAYYILKPPYEQCNQELVTTAQTYGARRWYIFTTITLPFLWPALCTAYSLSFNLSITEVGATTMTCEPLTMACAIKLYKKTTYDAGNIGMTCIVCLIAWIVGFLGTLY